MITEDFQSYLSSFENEEKCFTKTSFNSKTAGNFTVLIPSTKCVIALFVVKFGLKIAICMLL